MGVNIKVVAFSDNHGYLPKPIQEIPECDLVVIAGDIFPLACQTDVLKSISWFSGKFMPWAKSLPCEKVIFIGGNHDFALQSLLQGCLSVSSSRSPSEVLNILAWENNHEKKVVFLHDNLIEFRGKRIYGTPWVPALPKWAFYKSSEELVERFSQIPKKLDLLITHTPVPGPSGTVLETNYNYMKDFGCKELLEAICSRQIKRHVCGHVHSGMHSDTETSTCITNNVSLLDESYRPTYPVREFEI